MNANSKLRKWLNHSPRPVLVVCDDHKLDAPKTDRGWAELAESIEQLSPTKIVCLDAAGKVVRAKPFVHFFPDVVESEPETAPATELGSMAKLLADAYKNQSNSAAELLRNAMDFTERLASRLAKTEAELDKARGVIAALQGEIAQLQVPAEAPAEDPMAAMAVAAGMQAMGLTPPNVAPIRPQPPPKEKAK